MKTLEYHFISTIHSLYCSRHLPVQCTLYNEQKKTIAQPLPKHSKSLTLYWQIIENAGGSLHLKLEYKLTFR